MDRPTTFGDWLQQRRKALALTREQLAQRVGYSVSGLRKIESGERRPSLQIAELLANGLGVAAEERLLFLKVARGEMSLERLPSPQPAIAWPSQKRLASPPALRLNLPTYATRLVGRQAELAEVGRLLQEPECRLLTLVGPGGIGKTRLAIGAARQFGKILPDGVAFVPLAPLTAHSFIIPAVANALNFSFSGSADPQTQLLAYLGDKQLLLVLDNAEHLLSQGVAEFLAELLQRAPAVKLLITSREVLGLQAEWVFTVEGLSVSDSTTGTQGADGGAVELFLERAQRAYVGFVSSAQDQQAIVRICRLVEGIPLAIELAAAWVRVLSVAEIAQELECDPGRLVASVRDLPERHRSLRAVFEHSWRLLSSQEQQVLMKLSVFRGGFTRTAAEQVAGAPLSLLFGLSGKSLLQVMGEGRYSLHELVRQFGLAQLQAAGEVGQTCALHVQVFVQLAEAAESHLNQADQKRWLAYLDKEHDNLRAALDWALESGETEAGLRLAGALWRFWHIRTYLAEAIHWLDRALDAAGQAASPALRARALAGAGMLAFDQNDIDKALGYLEECLSLHSHLAERDLAHAQLTLALVLQERSDFELAASLHTQALLCFRRLNDEPGIVRTLNEQGMLALGLGDFNAAERLFGECLARARQGNYQGYITAAICNLGWIAALREDLAAIDLSREALRLSCDLGSRLSIAFCLEGLAGGLALAGQPERAVRLCSAADAVRAAIGAPLGGANRRYLEAMLQPTRKNLSAAAFVSAWAAGQDMPLEQAIGDGLQGDG
jgi:predicted ATPase/transcriptional regulator with XRE-family HTH domain